ncbi:ferrous iron transport protein A [Pseudoflavonifractor sp. DSM 107456]|uniref:Ferrous iron transport protein A n=2 Tax=Pseudoflavonifractor TaxID=1017280 RepID=A0ABR9R8H4_9FIRM|nr:MULTISPECIES: FeoA family protein [Eubacteriales]MBC5729547.1 ferrous iron transport protein A [Pseudoflavonifractor hominis]MBE5054984.1 ferrous iron transport protein A [Pseudoflavonifractor gallinarum]MBS5134591.1 ferrous iron transport protein A [Oscillospiraceae bacterium]
MREQPRLSALGVGEEARVCRVEAASALRRRLMDLGLVPGTRVTCVGKSPAGDPAAYAFRGAVIALRRADAEEVCLFAGAELPLEEEAVGAWD